MIVANDVRKEMGRILVEAVDRSPIVTGLWVSSDHDGVHFWLTTVPIDREEEIGLYELDDLLDERFPGAYFQLHILNQRHSTGSVRNAVPTRAEALIVRDA